jgi:DNA-binding NarL/FixJ family response regulator
MNAENKNEKSRIMVIEDHAIVRDGLVALINRVPDLTVCCEADSKAAAAKILLTDQPDLVIIDLMLSDGDGLDLIKDMRVRLPDLPFLVISMQDEEIYAERCLKAGASGYIMKHAATDEFMNAIHAVLDGEIFISKKMNVRLLSRFSDKLPVNRNGLESLTDRELQVYQMIGTGLNAREIAPKLGISHKTVATHRDNLKTKLGLKDSRMLMQAAIQWQQNKAD